MTDAEIISELKREPAAELLHYPKIFETIIIKHGLKRMLELAQENRQLSLF